jgi:Tfp pilus assembly protein PilN
MSINLLDWRNEKMLADFRGSIIRLVIYTFSFILIILYARINLLHDINVTQRNITALQNKTRHIAISVDAINNKKLLQKINFYFPEKEKVIDLNKQIGSILSLIAAHIPNSITLQSLTLSTHQLILSGVSDNLEDITLFNTILFQQRIGKNEAMPSIRNDAHNSSQLFFTEEISL